MSTATNHVDHQESDDESEPEKPVVAKSDAPSDKSTWDKIVDYILSKVDFLKTRDGRAAEIFNFLRGLEILFNPEGMLKWNILKI